MSTVIELAEGGKAEIDGLSLDLCDSTHAVAFARLSTHEARRIAAALLAAANEAEGRCPRMKVVVSPDGEPDVVPATGPRPRVSPAVRAERAPLPPDVLAHALQDTVHKETGVARAPHVGARVRGRGAQLGTVTGPSAYGETVSVLWDGLNIEFQVRCAVLEVVE